MYWRTLKDRFRSIGCDDHHLLMKARTCDRQKMENYETVDMGGNVIDVPFNQRPRGVYYTESTGRDYNNIKPVAFNAPLAIATMVVMMDLAIPKFKKLLLRNGTEEKKYKNWKAPTDGDAAKLKKAIEQMDKSMGTQIEDDDEIPRLFRSTSTLDLSAHDSDDDDDAASIRTIPRTKSLSFMVLNRRSVYSPHLPPPVEET